MLCSILVLKILPIENKEQGGVPYSFDKEHDISEANKE